MKSIVRIILFTTILCGLFAVTTVSHAVEEPFAQWLAQLRVDARAAGISSSTVDTALAKIKQPQPRVIHLDRNQPERKQTLKSYVEKRINTVRINSGQTMIERYPTWLKRIEQKYGVQQRFIVALWGIETNYGSYTGGFSVLQALVTLAYDGRRGTFFRKELLNALKIIDDGHVDVARMKGSWAGAMGQCQFMPSSFIHYAADGNGDGRIDIWGTIPDVLASIANYLNKVGWKNDQTWGREVRVPAQLDKALLGLNNQLPLSRWQTLGVRRNNGHDLPKRELKASLLMPDGPNGSAYLVYDNFRALRRWNRSNSFAIAVGLLSDHVSSTTK